ncbi:MAG TPA: hypothetical protein VK463_05115, partial [Desulfomonilaceae bacterium]|nr:hypothetical protein [Desulfomonilaceae bacterium]
MLKQSRKRILFLILGIFAVLTAGCIVPSQQTLKTEGTAQENGPAVNTVTVQSSGLIKPVIPEQNPKEAAIESAARFVPSPQPLPPAQ